jgi:hypothetical protein
MFRHKRAILREFCNTKGSQIKQKGFQTEKNMLDVWNFCFYDSPWGWLGAEACRSWHLTWRVFYDYVLLHFT